MSLRWTLVMALVAACGCAPDARQPDHDQLVAQVTATEVAFAKTMTDRDHNAFLSFIADDAVFINGDKPLRGRMAIGDGWKAYYTRATPPFSWKPELVEVNGSGTMALSTGPVLAPDGSLIAHYYSTWRREPDGQWRIVLDNGYDACDCAKQQ